MLNLLRSIFGAPEQAPNSKETLIAAAIEKAVDSSDPRLRAISGYQKRLRAATETSVDYVLDVVAALPSPLAMSPRVFGTDPQVRAYFGSADQMREVFSDARSVRNLLARPENESLTEFYTVLRMHLNEKRVLGSQLQGEMVRNDVLKTALNFGDHALASPSISETALRETLKERVFVGLIEQALQRMASAEGLSHDLKEQRAVLKTKLSALQARGLGLPTPPSKTNGTAKGADDIERQLEALEAKLKAMPSGGTTLEDNLEKLNDVLAHPDRNVTIGPETNRVTRMGYKADDGDEITYTRVKLRDSSFVALLVKYPRDELLPPRKFGDSIHI